MVKDYHGNDYPSLARARQQILWVHSIGDMLTGAYVMHESFALLLTQAHDIQQLHQKYAAQIKPTESLPEEYLLAILKFQYHLLRVAKRPLSQFKSAVPSSPPMRHLYWREPASNNTSNMGSL
jgi:hypothetical protein